MKGCAQFTGSLPGDIGLGIFPFPNASTAINTSLPAADSPHFDLLARLKALDKPRPTSVFLGDDNEEKVGLRVVAQNDCSFGHYKKGQRGIITRVNHTGSDSVVVRWDHSQKEEETRKNEIHRECIFLSDGTKAAVGLEVVHCDGVLKRRGVISKLNIADPVVCWDDNEEECEVRRGDLSDNTQLPECFLDDGNQAFVGLRVTAVANSSSAHALINDPDRTDEEKEKTMNENYIKGDRGTITKLTKWAPLVLWDRIDVEKHSRGSNLRRERLSLSDRDAVKKVLDTSTEFWFE